MTLCSRQELCQILDEDMSGALSLEELLSGYDRLPEFQDRESPGALILRKGAGFRVLAGYMTVYL